MRRKLRTHCDFEREPLLAPLGFKGGYLKELWQVIASLEDAEGRQGIGLGVQSVLWSDARVFAGRSETAGNREMFLTTRFALDQARRTDWDSPPDLMERLLPPVHEFAQHATGRRDLRLTFTLNALVALDHAAWLLDGQRRGITDFDDLIPKDILPALSFRHEKLAGVPLIAYDTPVEQVAGLVEEGAFVLKIKIGSDPAGDGSLDKMLEWDKQRLEAIHARVRGRETPLTENGRVAYYLDANGRYDTRERLMRLLDHAEAIGALERVLIVEEPFPEEYEESVEDIPVRLAADESAHSDQDARRRIEQGYRAIALKPIAKTLSMSLKIAKVAWERKIPCFCADLTGNPVLVDWNKNVAARLAPLPGMQIGFLESNGPQNYRNWDRMVSYHPRAGAGWMKLEGGCFTLDEDFYRHSGGIFEIGPHYRRLAGAAD